MKNTEYIAKMIHQNERIYIDTASLMEYDAMHQFLDNSRKLLLNAGRKIIIPSSVYTELTRHLDSDFLSKRECALEAINLIAENRELFEVHCVTLTEDEIAKAFADTHLISDLVLNKPIHNQLLITNDRKLSSDAYKLNQQQSCKGHRIMVCHINNRGQLHRCDCVAENMQEKPICSPAVDTQPVVSNTAPAEAIIPDATFAMENPSWSFNWVSAGIGFLGAVGTMLIGRNSKHFLVRI